LHGPISLSLTKSPNSTKPAEVSEPDEASESASPLTKQTQGTAESELLALTVGVLADTSMLVRIGISLTCVRLFVCLFYSLPDVVMPGIHGN
jgi:hypothetical protein